MSNESFGAKCGRWLGTLIVGCLATCLAAVCVALTIKFVMWVM